MSNAKVRARRRRRARMSRVAEIVVEELQYCNHVIGWLCALMGVRR